MAKAGALQKLSKFTKPDTRTVNRLLRKPAVDFFVACTRGALVVLCGLAVIYAAYQVFTSVSSAGSMIDAQTASIAGVRTGGEGNPARAGSERDYSLIAKQSVFGAIGVKAAPKVTAAAKPAQLATLILVGTFLSGTRDAYAIIEDKKKSVQDVFNLNDSVFGEAKLVEINSDNVHIIRQGQREILRLDDAPDSGSGQARGGVTVTGTDEFTVDEAELNQALENLPLLLTQARAVPYFQDGKAVGLRLFALKSGSLFEKIGLRNGDILKAINGNSLADLSQALRLFETLKQERSLNVVLQRDRADREFRYQIR